MSKKKITAIGTSLVAVAALGGVAASSGAAGTAGGNGSRLDDGKALLPQAQVTEAQAIAAAQGAASGPLNEVDLEPWAGKLAFNVDVGAQEVKVDAKTGEVLAVVKAD